MRKAIILAGGTGSRLFPLTISVSKQLMPIYDKPMIYYPLSVLMLAGMREVLLITTGKDLPRFEELLGDGRQLGIEISYLVQERPEGLAQAFLLAEEFLAGEAVALILGDNLFYGAKFMDRVKAASGRENGASVFGYHVANPSDYGVVEFDDRQKVVSLEEKPERPKSNWAVPGMYFFDATVVARAKKLVPSARGELEVVDLCQSYLADEELEVELLGRGVTWLDTGTPDALIEASQFVQTIQLRQNLKIGCVEEIAWGKGWIDDEELRALAKRLGKTEYGEYLERVLNGWVAGY